MFSVAGLTLSKLRASLDKETVNEILFLHKHLKGTITGLLEDFPSDGSEFPTYKSKDTLLPTNNPSSGLLDSQKLEIIHEVDASEINDFLPESFLG